MKFSEQWLREWVNPSCDTQTLADQLTMSGLEVDSVEPAAGEFTGVVVGHVVSCEKHPDADKLSCCKVDVGAAEFLSIVCGAPNVRKDLKVAVARIGAVLPGDFKIKKTKLRGQLSEGMICSTKELGLHDDHAGILELHEDAPIGTDFREYFSLDDNVIDIELTPNRADCASLQGVAREVGVLNHLPVTMPDCAPVSATIKDVLSIKLSAHEECPHYVGRVIRNISKAAKTPVWMEERLRRSGIRKIHPVVDVCNYVMIELGQPMHAFNHDALTGDITVRLARQGEVLKLIDENNVELKSTTLVIADKKGPQAIAGIMGGDDSAVTESTENIFLESAFFSPVNIRLSAREYGLQTDASYRFERGVDTALQIRAIERATALLLDITGGDAGPVIEAKHPSAGAAAQVITLRYAQIERILGITIPQNRVVEIFEDLGMGVELQGDNFAVTIPTYRFDIAIEVDLIEELGRIYGYDNIPTVPMPVELRLPEVSEAVVSRKRLAHLLVDRDYSECISYSFVDPELQSLMDPGQPSQALANPISVDMSVMRTNLWAGLVQAVKHNQNRQQSRVRLFEFGLCFKPQKEGWAQTPKLGMIAVGPQAEQQWGLPDRATDFFDMKRDIEALIALTGEPEAFSWGRSDHPVLHPGQSAQLVKNGRIVGHLGALHPKIAQHLELNEVPLLLEVELDAISTAQLPDFKVISKFPAVRRDLAFVMDQAATAKQIAEAIRQSAGNLLTDIQIFDVYQGKGIEVGKKSVALGLTFQDASRTLVDTEINEVIQHVVAHLEREVNAKLRT